MLFCGALSLLTVALQPSVPSAVAATASGRADSHRTVLLPKSGAPVVWAPSFDQWAAVTAVDGFSYGSGASVTFLLVQSGDPSVQHWFVYHRAAQKNKIIAKFLTSLEKAKLPDGTVQYDEPLNK
jgi:hypothetical protein